MMGALAGEWTKLRTLRSPAWTALAALAALAGIGTLQMIFTKDDIGPADALAAGSQLGMLLITAMAAVATTGDYGTGTHRLSVMADSNRTRLYAAKAVVVALACGVTAAIGVAVLAVVGALSPHVVGDWDSEVTRRMLMTIPVWMIAGLIAVAVGTLLRQTALTVTLLMVWPLAVETLVYLIPKIGQTVSGWMPFTNLFALAQPSAAMPHGVLASVLAPLAVALVLSVIAVAVERRRAA